MANFVSFDRRDCKVYPWKTVINLLKAGFGNIRQDKNVPSGVGQELSGWLLEFCDCPNCIVYYAKNRVNRFGSSIKNFLDKSLL
jgi:hypothetical protein